MKERAWDRRSDEPTNLSVEPSVWRDPDANGASALAKMRAVPSGHVFCPPFPVQRCGHGLTTPSRRPARHQRDAACVQHHTSSGVMSHPCGWRC